MTTKEFKQDKNWPVIEECIIAAIAQYKNIFPFDRVELIDHGDKWTIDINGIPSEEITCEVPPMLNK